MKKKSKSNRKALGIVSIVAGLVIGYLCISTGDFAIAGFGILFGGSLVFYGIVLFWFNVSLTSIFENWFDSLQ